MSIITKGLLVGAAALGIMAGAGSAHADEYYRYGYQQPAAPFRVHFWHRWGARPVVVAPPAPVYYGQPYAGQPYSPQAYQPSYEPQPVDFPSHVRAELGAIEAEVRARVAAGQLDGNALTAMEAAREDLEQDIVDLTAKGYISDADRAHMELDLSKLRQKFGC